MKTQRPTPLFFLCLMAAAALAAANACAQEILVRPARGGGLDTNAPMIHVDIFYDYQANQMIAELDTTKGVPHLTPLPPGYAFDSRSNYYVLTDKAYSLQYAWNPGGIFTPPEGAAVWIECLNASPGLETCDGPGNKNENPPRPYTPIFGTGGSPTKWAWYGRMAHNAYAIRQSTTSVLSAEYRVYFGDAQTGARDAFSQYDDATVTLTWTVDPVAVPPVLVRPARGGGLDTNAPMIHVDIFYDYQANQMVAQLDTTKGVPHLTPLPPGYAFDSRSNYYVLTDKAYSLQYAWNPGGVFTPPEGAAVWIECLNASPGLETYDGPGNKNENPPRPYTPIFGTGGSPTKWAWYGRMAHNAYAIRQSTTSVLSAEYRVYFGDAQTGARDAFSQYDDATVTLTWTVDPVTEPPTFLFGAAGQDPGAPVCFLNADELAIGSESVVTLRRAEGGPWASHFAGFLPMVAVAATEANGGPVAGHAAPGSCLELELVSLAGPSNGCLHVWEAGDTQPRLNLPVGEVAGMSRLRLSENQGMPGADPHGKIQGRRFSLTQPGLYCLSFRVVDSSTNGPQGGPIHPPSPLYHVYLQAGLTLASLTAHGSCASASFGGEPGRSFYLERTQALGGAAPWETVAGPLAGVSRLQTLADPAAPSGPAFYRVRSTVQ